MQEPDFASVPELGEEERALIRSYVKRTDPEAGRRVSPKLLHPSDADSIRFGARYIYEYKIKRLTKLRDMATDDRLKACLGARMQCMEDAWAVRDERCPYALVEQPCDEYGYLIWGCTCRQCYEQRVPGECKEHADDAAAVEVDHEVMVAVPPTESTAS